jgi:hypothetical protein
MGHRQRGQRLRADRERGKPGSSLAATVKDEYERRAEPRWASGILALIVAAVAIGTLGWMLWPRDLGDQRPA